LGKNSGSAAASSSSSSSSSADLTSASFPLFCYSFGACLAPPFGSGVFLLAGVSAGSSSSFFSSSSDSDEAFSSSYGFIRFSAISEIGRSRT